MAKNSEQRAKKWFKEIRGINCKPYKFNANCTVPWATSVRKHLLVGPSIVSTVNCFVYLNSITPSFVKGSLYQRLFTF